MKYKIKFIVCISLLMMMFLLISGTVFAKDNFRILETKNSDGTITRVYEKNKTEQLYSTELRSSSPDYNEIKCILKELGMEDSFINNLTQDDLEFYNNSPRIVGKIAYIKSSPEGMKKIVSENEALEEVAILNQKNLIVPYSGSEHKQDTYQDDYMRVFHMVSQDRYSSSFRHSTDARWLRMPFFRRVDSIGSCAQETSVTPGTERGYCEYNVQYLYPWGPSEKVFRKNDISNNDFNRDYFSGFNGAAAKLYLPKDIYSNESTSIVYSDYKAHFQFDGRVQHPDQSIYFDSIGTYDHLRYEIGFEPGIAIGKDGGSISIGLSLSNGSDKRSVPLQIYYQP